LRGSAFLLGDTLIGDASHAKTPGRGVEAVNRYETKMIKYGFDAVLKSREQMTADDPIHKPVIGRLVLALLRTAMRVTNHARPLKERMARSMLQYRGAGRDGADFVLPARAAVGKSA
jgi:hypothetical protein